MTIPEVIQLGLEHHRAGRLREAEHLYQQVLGADPNNPDALHLYGLIAHQVGKFEIAVQSMNKALLIKPDFAEALFNLGNALQGLKRYEEALASYDKVLLIVPRLAEALSNRGNALVELGRYDEALASCDQALLIKANYADALLNRGNALQGLKRYEEALVSYDKALTIKPDFAEALRNCGNALQGLKRYEEALISYDKALKIKPDFSEVLGNRGNALQRLRRYDEALASYEDALTIKPDFAEVLGNRGITRLYQAKVDARSVMVASNSVGMLTLRFLASIDEVTCASWNRCVPTGNPFLRHEFLAALEHSGTIGVDRGILPCHAVLEDETAKIVAAAPGVIKWNTLGEYGPEMFWMKTLIERQMHWKYFPKYQLDIPLTPVSTPKMLVAPGWPRDLMGPLLLQLVMKSAQAQTDFASFHVYRFHEDELHWIRSAGLLISREPCSVWRNRGYSSFDDWLGALRSKRRYYIRQERRFANESGLSFRILRGAEITPTHWADFHRGYIAVCAQHKSAVLLAPGFYPAISAFLGQQIMLFAAFNGDDFVAGAACVHQEDTLHIWNWSMLIDRPNLVFELVMHRPIDWAIETGVNKVDASIITSYKSYRGYVAEPIQSAHWLRNPVLAGELEQMIAKYDRDVYSNPAEGGGHVKLFRRDKNNAEQDLVRSKKGFGTVYK